MFQFRRSMFQFQLSMFQFRRSMFQFVLLPLNMFQFMLSAYDVSICAVRSEVSVPTFECIRLHMQLLVSTFDPTSFQGTVIT